jgi:hypothetical protein
VLGRGVYQDEGGVVVFQIKSGTVAAGVQLYIYESKCKKAESVDF